MMKNMTKAEHLALLKDAIDATLKARTDHDERRYAEHNGQRTFKLLRAFDLKDKDWERERLEGIVKDPVFRALRRQLEDLGQKLYRLTGSTEAMLDVCNEVAARDPRHEDDRLNIIDKAWDGIGNGKDIWLA
jgi:hypothetical protein